MSKYSINRAIILFMIFCVSGLNFINGVNPEMEFACALITNRNILKTRHNQHLRSANTGSEEGSLLAINLDLHFRDWLNRCRVDKISIKYVYQAVSWTCKGNWPQKKTKLYKLFRVVGNIITSNSCHSGVYLKNTTLLSIKIDSYRMTKDGLLNSMEIQYKYKTITIFHTIS